MVDVLVALLHSDLLSPELLYTINKFLFGPWLHSGFQVELKLVPQVFDRIEVGAFWRSPPPVYAVFFKEGLRNSRGMFWIVILHEAVLWKLLSEKGNQRGSKYVAVEVGFHNPLEDADFRCSMPADTGPNVDFKWVLRLWLSLSWLTNLPVARAAELLKRDWAFIAEDYVVKCISRVDYSPGKLKSLDFVYISDQLTVLRVLKGPTKFFAGSSHSW